MDKAYRTRTDILEKASLSEVARFILRLGTTAFGGPAAHIAMMEDEVVRRRQWVSREKFLDLLGASNLIPGPNSTEMAIFIGYLCHGWAGLFLGGLCFILPAMVIVIGFAWAYVQFGSLPQVTWLLYGVKPVVIAIILQALWQLGRTAIKDRFLGALALLGIILNLMGIKLEESLRRHEESHKHREHTPTGTAPQPDAAPRPGQDPGMKEVIFAPSATYQVKPLELPPDRTPKKALGRRTQAPTEDKSGRYVRSTPSPKGAPDLALDATLRAAAPYQTLREKGNLALAVAPPDVRHKVREKRIGHHILFVVDASGSMGAEQRMSETKAAILSLLLDAYQKRERVGLITFRGQKAELALPFTNSVETARKCLEHLPTGGKTPLPHALHLAYEVIHQEKLKHPKDAFLLVLITDGKANISLGPAPAIVETKKLAVQLRGLNINALVLDTEVHTPMIDFGCLPELTKTLGGQYLSIQSLQASDVVARIAEVRG